MTLFRCVVYGLPAPQGSKRHVGKGIMVESSKNVAPWREAVKQAALVVLADGQGGLESPLDGPLIVTMEFVLPRPKSAKPDARPDKRPDLSKLIRAAEDALTDAGVWADDARVVTCNASKWYVGPGCERPGMIVTVSRV